MTANNSKSDLSYLNKLVDQYNSLYHHYFNKKAIKADFSALDEKIETSHKASKFNGNDRVGITKYNRIVSNSYIENWSMERFIVNSVLKTIPQTYNIKELNGEKLRKSFSEKQLLPRKL